MNKPDIRFNGFDEEWEEKNYKEVFDTSVSNNTLSRAELTSERTSTKNVHYGDILIKYNSILDVKKDDFPFVPDEVKIDSRNFLKNGDIVFADTAEDETCGKATEINNLEHENVVAGLHTFVARPKNVFEEKYLGYLVNSPAYHNQLIPFMQGTKVTSISKSNIQKTTVKYPESAEQKKLGALFSQIDSLIASTQKEHEKLVALKKCMLQKMFPKKGSLIPEIRFEGFSGDWVEKKYQEIFDTSISNNTLSRSELINEKTVIKNVHYGDILIKYGSILDVEKDDFQFVPDLIKINSKNFLKNGDIVFADTAEDETCGKATEINNLGKDCVVAGLHTFVARPKEAFANFFLGYFINSPCYHNQLIPYMQGTKVTSISKSNMYKSVLFYPSLPEQQKIGSYFQNLDNLISKQSAELEKLKNVKKTLLSKMFV